MTDTYGFQSLAMKEKEPIHTVSLMMSSGSPGRRNDYFSLVNMFGKTQMVLYSLSPFDQQYCLRS